MDSSPDTHADFGADAAVSARLRLFVRRQRRALEFVGILGWLTAFACLAILFSYPAGFVRGYQSWPGGPGTSPLTAAALLLLAGALITHRPQRKPGIESVLLVSAVAIASLRLAEISIGFSILPGTTFQPDPQAPPIGFGWNSAFGIALSGMTLLAIGRLRPVIVQILGGIAIASPLVALVGFGYGLAHFYGRTSPYTAIILIAIAAGAALASSRHGMMHVLISPFFAGRLARIQLLGAFLIPFGVGYALLNAGGAAAGPVIGLGVTSTAIFMAVLMSVSLLALDRAESHRRRAERIVRFEATHDHLTGLANRRLFVDVAEMELKRATRHGTDCCVIAIDLDHFKSINDTFGHDAGDRVLQRTAKILIANLRAGDLLARQGGEEFAVFLPDTSEADAAALAERLRAAMKRADFSAELKPGRAVTISAGVARRNDGRDSLAELLRAADAALYTAKTNGRNRVERSTEGAR